VADSSDSDPAAGPDEVRAENDVLLARIANDSVRLDALDAELRSARHRIETLEADLARATDRKAGETAVLEQRLAGLADEHRRAEELLAAERVRSEDQLRHIEQLQNSFSYRLTKPLRLVQSRRLGRRSPSK
jgi:predicted  nucleic acid-binding Zn-ribbon protein